MVFLVVATTANMHDEIVMYSATCTRGGGGSSANVGQVVYTLVLVHRHMVEIFNVCVHDLSCLYAWEAYYSVGKE